MKNTTNLNQQTNKSVKWIGVIMGFLFTGLSLLFGATMIVPIGLAVLMESMSENFASLTNGNSGIAAFYVGLICLIFPIVFYLRAMVKKSSVSSVYLFVMFLFFIIFLNTTIYFKDWLQPNFKADGQQAYGMIAAFFKTSWVFLTVGILHDLIERKRNLD